MCVYIARTRTHIHIHVLLKVQQQPGSLTGVIPWDIRHHYVRARTHTRTHMCYSRCSDTLVHRQAWSHGEAQALAVICWEGLCMYGCVYGSVCVCMRVCMYTIGMYTIVVLLQGWDSAHASVNTHTHTHTQRPKDHAPDTACTYTERKRDRQTQKGRQIMVLIACTVRERKRDRQIDHLARLQGRDGAHASVNTQTHTHTKTDRSCFWQRALREKERETGRSPGQAARKRWCSCHCWRLRTCCSFLLQQQYW